MYYISSLEQSQGILSHHKVTLPLEGLAQETLLVVKHKSIEIYLSQSSSGQPCPCKLYAQLDLLKALRDVTPLAPGLPYSGAPVLLLIFQDGEYLLSQMDLSQPGRLVLLTLLNDHLPLEQPLSQDLPTCHVARHYLSSPGQSPLNHGYALLLSPDRALMLEWQLKVCSDQSLEAQSTFSIIDAIYPHQIHQLFPVHSPALSQRGDFSSYGVVGYLCSDQQQFSSNFNQSIRFLDVAPTFCSEIRENQLYGNWIIQLRVKTYGAVSLSDRCLLVFTKTGILYFLKGQDRHCAVVQLCLQLSALCPTDINDLFIVSTRKKALFLLSYKCQESLGIDQMNTNSDVLHYKYLGTLQQSTKLTFLGQSRLMSSNPQESSYLVRISEKILSAEEQCVQLESEFRQNGNVLDLGHQHRHLNSMLLSVHEDSLLNSLQKGSLLDRLASLALPSPPHPRQLVLLHKRFLVIIASRHLLLYHLKPASFLFLQSVPVQETILDVHPLPQKYQFLLVSQNALRLFSFDGSLFVEQKNQPVASLSGSVQRLTHSLLGDDYLLLLDRSNLLLRCSIPQQLSLVQQVQLEGQVSQLATRGEELLIAYWNSSEIESRALSNLEVLQGWLNVKHLDKKDSICSMVVQGQSVIVGTSQGLIVCLATESSEEKAVMGGSSPVKLIVLPLSDRLISVSNRTMALSYDSNLHHFEQTYIAQDNITYVQEVSLQDRLLHLFLICDPSGSHLVLGSFNKNQKYISVPVSLDSQALLSSFEPDQLCQLSENLVAISLNSSDSPPRSKIVTVDLCTQQFKDSLEFSSSFITEMTFHSPLLFVALEKQQPNRDLEHPLNNIVSELVVYNVQQDGLTQLARNCFMDRVVAVRHIEGNLFLVGLSEQLQVMQVQMASHHTRNIMQHVAEKPLSSVITSVQVKDRQFMVADYFKNILIYYFMDNVIYPLAYTPPAPDRLIEAHFFGSETKSVLGSYLSGDVIIYSPQPRPNKDKDLLRLEVQCSFRYPEVLTRMIDVEGLDGSASILFGTLNGSTGFICQLSQKHYDLLANVQSTLQEYYSSVKYPSIMLTHPKQSTKHLIINGDYVKTISQLSQHVVQSILNQQCTLSELLLLLDSLEKNIFQ